MDKVVLGRALAAFFSGAAAVLGFAPYSLGWVAILSLAALLALIRPVGAASAFRLGWLWGMGCMGFGVFWLHNSIAQFGGISLPLAILMTLLFAALLALFPATAAWLSKRLFADKGRVAWLFAFAAIWVLLEWVRSWLFSGFPWLTLGYSQIETWLSGYAPVLGVYGVSLALTLSAVTINLYRRWWILLLPVIWLGGWALQQLQWTQSKGQAFTATLVQASIPQEKKWLPSQFKPTLEYYVASIGAHPGSRLIIWPETAIPAFSYQLESSFLRPLHERLQKQGQDLLLGIPVYDDQQRSYNALMSLGASGREQYFKRHLVPFGEFMPFERLLKPLVDMFAIPMSSFTAGDVHKPPLLTLAGMEAGASICYEDSFGEEIAQALPQAAFLVNASNDAWFGDSLAPHQHLQMARMRTLETGRYMLRATNTGVSAIIDQRGQLLEVLPQFERGSISAGIQPREGRTPFVIWKNSMALVLVAFILLLSYLRRFGGTPSMP